MRWLIKIFILLLFSAGIWLYFSPKPPQLENLSFSKAFYDTHGQLLKLTLSTDDKYRLYTPLKDISPEFIQATLYQEDRYFRLHPGINPFSLLNAAWKTYGIKERRFGGSTITMQLARLRYNLYSKNLSGKLLQMLYAIRLEQHYSKDQILEAYLNLAPYGGNIEGVGAASLIYLRRPASQITSADAKILALIPQHPTKRLPDIQKKLPFEAPHFVNLILQQKKTETNVATTLDLRIQKIIEQGTKKYIERKRHLGIKNASVLVVDTQTMNILALLGSADFYDVGIAGQVNGTHAKRSPGSALKPFIYALAIDQGLIHPQTLLKDTPKSFGAYNPENFDQTFMGPISAKDALILSRNIPAIYLSERLKNPSLYEFLKQAEISRLRSESFYGLALALGGAEISMEELASLYATLINQGILKPLRTQKNEVSLPGKRLLSPEAAFLTLDMLQQNPRPGTSSNPFPVAWKTGTSSGYRDAWSVGLFDHYLILTWIGNFSGAGNPSFVGTEIAAPMMFELIDAMKSQTTRRDEGRGKPRPYSIKKIAVCSVSGMLPTRHCKNQIDTWFIPGKSPIKTDTIHREIAIDAKTGLRTCQIDQNTVFQIYEFWPSDLLKLFQQAGMKRRTPPAFLPACTLAQEGLTGTPPVITSPQTDMTYTVRSKENSHIPFSAIVDADVKKLHWFLNEAYIGHSALHEPLLWLAKPGRYVIRAVDDQGRSDVKNLVVVLINQ